MPTPRCLILGGVIYKTVLVSANPTATVSLPYGLYMVGDSNISGAGSVCFIYVANHESNFLVTPQSVWTEGPYNITFPEKNKVSFSFSSGVGGYFYLWRVSR